ncbi:NADPH:quinone oxidoreductase family protein [Methylobacterium planeticum]|uniref:NADPH:quinone oxidoreductase family protein n=1 Tax=Methylobacterium planeticum TaxID=2615211 RepID=A0A6N6MKB7_9HYPH|nr:NADPH:quinone oxidoreductase family protein [Methylobacterium planeticum]KAB1071029.1 NADPH:quinone oxidoreductase family protein [Methylobacterium planeticum]
MKALLCTRLGGPEDLSIETLPDPVPGPGQALVRVRAAALNFFDTLIIAGRYQVKPELPFSPGGEACGVVEALGSGGRNPEDPGRTSYDVERSSYDDGRRDLDLFQGISVGDRVIVHETFGTCRERVVVDLARLTPVPEVVSDEQAAGLTITYGTSLHALRDRARLQPGETLAVLGASGGVGLAAVELGKVMGARVIACASSEEKLAIARQHGADETLVYSPDTLKDALRGLTGGRGVDVVYDAVGGAYAEPALRALAWKGRFLVVGFAAGDIPRIPLNLVLLRGLDVQGVHWGVFVEREPEAHRANQRQLLAWVAEGRLSAKVHGVYPMTDYAAALGILKRREAVGKVLLRP